MVSLPALAQKAAKKTIISGKVTDTNGKPVAGAMIFIDKLNSNKLTDNKGFYKVKVKPSAVNLSIFSAGHGASESRIDGRSVINFTLKASSSDGITNRTSPEETREVNVGYGTQNRDNLTTPVSSVDIQKENSVTYSDIYQMISGKVPGVQVSGHKITISGASSFIASTDPLLVVNGMVVNSIDDINPVYVKSIEVLKGPAASVYGSRGANGVILINLK